MGRIDTAPRTAVIQHAGVSSPSARTVTENQLASPAGRMVVIVNPATHGNASAIVELMRRHAPTDVELDVRFTPGAGTTTALTLEALSEEARAVVAVGGDGTVAQVAAALLHTDIPIGVVPGGSTNITARQAGIPADPVKAVRLLFGPHRHEVFDAGLWNNVPFLHMAGAGLDSRLFADSSPALKRHVGWLAYVLPALRDLRHSLVHFNVVADGVSLDLNARAVLVANASAIISPHLSLFPGIRTDDGWLDVLAFTPVTPSQVMEVLTCAATRRMAESHYVTHLRARRIQIASEPLLPVELDGDVVTQTPVTLTIAPAAVRFIVPT